MDEIRALIPAAGYGTRLFPSSIAMPKELFPLNRKPMIHLAVEEAMDAGISRIGLVIRKGKESIRRYFEALVASSEASNCDLERLSRLEIHYVFQKRALGLGNAVYEAADFIGNSPFVMIIPDQFLLSEVPAAQQLLDAVKGDSQAVWSSLARITPAEAHLFPGARAFQLGDRIGCGWKVLTLEETSQKPGGDKFLGFGRTYFPPGVMEFFSDRFINPRTGEVDLLHTFQGLIENFPNYAVLLEGKAMDFGTWPGYERYFPEYGRAKSRRNENRP